MKLTASSRPSLSLSLSFSLSLSLSPFLSPSPEATHFRFLHAPLPTMCKWYCTSEGGGCDLACVHCGAHYCSACLHGEAGKMKSLIKCARCGKKPRTKSKQDRGTWNDTRSAADTLGGDRFNMGIKAAGLKHGQTIHKHTENQLGGAGGAGYGAASVRGESALDAQRREQNVSRHGYVPRNHAGHKEVGASGIHDDEAAKFEQRRRLLRSHLTDKERATLARQRGEEVQETLDVPGFGAAHGHGPSRLDGAMSRDSSRRAPSGGAAQEYNPSQHRQEFEGGGGGGGGGGGVLGAAAAAAPTQQIAVGALPPDWYEATYEGKLYYVNRHTNETSWVRPSVPGPPPGMAPPPPAGGAGAAPGRRRRLSAEGRNLMGNMMGGSGGGGGGGDSSVFDRLTNSSAYTGTHQHRFDCDGQGRGMLGRDTGATGQGYIGSGLMR